MRQCNLYDDELGDMKGSQNSHLRILKLHDAYQKYKQFKMGETLFSFKTNEGGE